MLVRSKSLSFRRVVFFYPSHVVGGVELLFYRLAKLCGESDIKIAIIDFEFGFIPNKLRAEKIAFDYIDVEYKGDFDLSTDDILICPLSMVNSDLLKKVNNPESRIVFWDLHPHNLIEQTAFSLFYKRKSEGSVQNFLKFIETKNINRINTMMAHMNHHNAVYFMCKSNFDFSDRFFNLDLQPRYLPILVENSTSEVRNISNISERKGLLTFAWLGRLDKDKIDCLNLLLKDLDEINLASSAIVCSFLVIGDGDCKDNVYKPTKFNLQLLGNKSLIELDEIIENKVDIGFAIGTSSLEFAIRKTPVIMLPNPLELKYFEATPNRYALLADSVNYEICVERYFNKNKVMAINDIVHLDIESAGRRCFRYYQENHESRFVFQKFITSLDSSSLKLGSWKNKSEADVISKMLLSLKKVFRLVLRG